MAYVSSDNGNFHRTVLGLGAATAGIIFVVNCMPDLGSLTSENTTSATSSSSSSSSSGTGGSSPGCRKDEDCQGQSCVAGACVDPCTDKRLDGDETDTDCGGGTCAMCEAGGACKMDSDCTTGLCSNGACTAKGCTNKVQDGNETDTDCGGDCAPAHQCTMGQHCAVASDCESYLCDRTAKTCLPDDVVAQGDMIDDMEAQSVNILPLGGRVGNWFPYSDPSAGSMTGPTATAIPNGRVNSKFAQFVSCTTAYTTWGSGIGFDFLNPSKNSMTKQPYDASSHGGIKFWARSDNNVEVRFQVIDRDTYQFGGICGMDAGSASACSDAFQIPVELGPQWTLFQIHWKDLTQQGYGQKFPAVDPTQLIGCQWQVSAGSKYQFWIDDVAFFN